MLITVRDAWHIILLHLGCPTYLKVRAINKSGNKVEGHNRCLEAVPQWGSGANPLKLTTFY